MDQPIQQQQTQQPHLQHSNSKEPKNTIHLIYHSYGGGGGGNVSASSSGTQLTGIPVTLGSASNEDAIGSSSTSSCVGAGQLNESELFDAKLAEVSEQITTRGHWESSALAGLVVESAVISSNHLAFLLDDGRVCRVGFRYNAAEPIGSQQPSQQQQPQQQQQQRSSKHSKIAHSSSLASAFGVQPGEQSTLMGSSYRSTSSARNLASYTASQLAAAAAAAVNSTNTSSSGSGVRSGEAAAAAAFIIPSQHDILNSGTTSLGFGRGRRGQLMRGRVNSLIVGSRMPPIIPVSAVPESLIESVQTVLQSKSRTVIVRELQRTNLDVNLAVNNLLQRDDEGDDPTDDEDPYMQGDDLISLLDINSHSGESVLIDSDGSNVFDEDAFRLTRRFGNAGGSSGNSATAANNAATTTTTTTSVRINPPPSGGSGSDTTATAASSGESNRAKSGSYRIRDHRWYDAYRDDIFSSQNLHSSHLHHNHHHYHSHAQPQPGSTQRTSVSINTDADNVLSKTSDKSDADKSGKNTSSQATGTTSKGSGSATSSFVFDENFQYWRYDGLGINETSTPVFVKIAGMYSELVALSKDGKLHQWKWKSNIPYVTTTSVMSDAGNLLLAIYHPKTVPLNLLNEKCVGISCSKMRASVWTDSGKVKIFKSLN